MCYPVETICREHFESDETKEGHNKKIIFIIIIILFIFNIIGRFVWPRVLFEYFNI